MRATDAFGSVLAALEEKGYTFVQAAVEMVPQNYVKLENEDDIKNMEKLIDLLDEIRYFLYDACNQEYPP